ncbi:hypothetical protein C8J57DRAFT_1249578 [Mycena rebaudengoi]|nr:hypothetical protein C8J57DRAFT_1249578 [Mycena rebaudengoi]
MAADTEMGCEGVCGCGGGLAVTARLRENGHSKKLMRDFPRREEAAGGHGQTRTQRATRVRDEMLNETRGYPSRWDAKVCVGVGGGLAVTARLRENGHSKKLMRDFPRREEAAGGHGQTRTQRATRVRDEMLNETRGYPTRAKLQEQRSREGKRSGPEVPHTELSDRMTCNSTARQRIESQYPEGSQAWRRIRVPTTDDGKESPILNNKVQPVRGGKGHNWSLCQRAGGAGQSVEKLHQCLCSSAMMDEASGCQTRISSSGTDDEEHPKVRLKKRQDEANAWWNEVAGMLVLRWKKRL